MNKIKWQITMANSHNIMAKRSVEHGGSLPRYKMALLTWAAAFPLLTAVNVLLGPELAALPLLGRTFLVTGILTSLLTFVVMPRLTWLCANWLLLPSAARGHRNTVVISEKPGQVQSDLTAEPIWVGPQ